jgi:hypothetical protein
MILALFPEDVKTAWRLFCLLSFCIGIPSSSVFLVLFIEFLCHVSRRWTNLETYVVAMYVAMFLQGDYRLRNFVSLT